MERLGTMVLSNSIATLIGAFNYSDVLLDALIDLKEKDVGISVENELKLS